MLCMNPPVVLRWLDMDTGSRQARKICVAREDFLPGGTKQRGVIPFLRELKSQGHRKMVYVSPFAGFAQIALASGCEQVGLECELYCSKDPRHSGLVAHPYTERARAHGANVRILNDLDEANRAADESLGDGFRVPLGFAHPSFYRAYREALIAEWVQIESAHGLPARVWFSVGSGTLARTLQSFVPQSVDLMGVDVHVLSSDDQRISELARDRRFKLLSAPLEFVQTATDAPPFTSNAHYDAKVWGALKAERGPSEGYELYWNVAG